MFKQQVGVSLQLHVTGGAQFLNDLLVERVSAVIRTDGNSHLRLLKDKIKDVNYRGILLRGSGQLHGERPA